jgi:hypothetical protein
MARTVRGEFEVRLRPRGPSDATGGVLLGRMSISKRFHGPLDASSAGQMLMATTPVDGSAGYVAIERVTGTLAGRRGSFVLQHSGVLTRGSAELSVRVVPDSATGALTGLSGTMTIQIVEGKHTYGFEYSLPRSGPAGGSNRRR